MFGSLVFGYRDAKVRDLFPSPGTFLLHVDLQYCALFPSLLAHLLLPCYTGSTLSGEGPKYKAVTFPEIQMTLYLHHRYFI